MICIVFMWPALEGIKSISLVLYLWFQLDSLTYGGWVNINGHHFVDNNFNYMFLKESHFILKEISLNTPALIHRIVWYHVGI